ncbi:uncharacterized protein LOC142574731 [Dermacentor variabilis]|uniref:uncharacterized protein LOC142574731 n=1 Tax=Dermacentor variabilis TaxID=34621 RepID=UPI003F5BA06C
MAFGVRIGEFHLNGKSSWEDYVERIELCCTANKLKQDVDKRAVLLSRCGADTYSFIATLVKPLRPPNADYQSIVKAVKNHINPKPSELYSRCVFSKRDQHDAESVADYVTALRKLAENCGFNDNQLPLHVMLRDRLVFGISDSIVQQRLLADKDLTFKTAYDLAVMAEAAAKHQRVMGGLRQDVPVLTAKLDRQPRKQHKKGQDVKTSSEQLKLQCFRCLGNHTAYRCRFQTAICFNGSVKGHLAKACRKKQGGAALPPLHIKLKEDARPKFLKCRSTPFALKDDVITELEKLEQEHHEIFMEVLNRLLKAGLRIQGAKCQFFKESLEYMGHRIDATGIYPSKAKVEAIHKAPVPRNKELQGFLVEYPLVSAADASSATMPDPCLSRVKKWVATGWSEQGVPPEYAAYQDLFVVLKPRGTPDLKMAFKHGDEGSPVAQYVGEVAAGDLNTTPVADKLIRDFALQIGGHSYPFRGHLKLNGEVCKGVINVRRNEATTSFKPKLY